MTKDELSNTVETIYAMWNKELPNTVDAKKKVYEAWWRLLKDIEQEQALQAADRLALRETFLPTPGTIKTEHLRTTGTLTAAEAWNEYLKVKDAINNGTWDSTQIPPRLKTTIYKVGLNLHTNDDRRHFTETYNTTQ